MKFVISFDIDNAAFGETFEDAADEIHHLLCKIGVAVRYPKDPIQPGSRFPVRDSNGNTIGFYGLIEEGGA